MASGDDWATAAFVKYEEYQKTKAFIANATYFCKTHNVPVSVSDLIFESFFRSDFNYVVRLVKQLTAIISEYESAAVALRFSSSLPPKLIQELRQQIENTKEGAYRWARESCEKIGVEGVDEALKDAKAWFEWLAKQPNKTAIELECQGLVEQMKAIPADNYNWS